MVYFGIAVAVLGAAWGMWPWAAEPYLMPKLLLSLLGCAIAHLGLQWRARCYGQAEEGAEAFPIAVWTLILALGCAVSCDPSVSLLGARGSGSGSVLAWISVAAAVSAAASSGIPSGRLNALAALAGFGAAGYAVLQRWAGWDPFFDHHAAVFGGRAFGPMGGPILLGPLLAVCLPAAAASCRRGALRLVPWLILAGLVASGTRAALGAGVVGVLAVLALERGIPGTRMALASAMVIGLAVVSRAGALMSDVGRVEVWRIAWTGFLERPLTGWGPDTFGLVMRRYIGPAFLEAYNGNLTITQGHAHNLLLQVLFSTGLLGLVGLLCCLPFGWLAWRARTREDAPALGAALAVLLCAQTNPVPTSAWLLAGVLLGPLLGCPALRRPRTVPAWVPALACAGLVALSWRLLGAELEAYKGLRARALGEGLRSAHHFNRAGRLNPWSAEHVARQLDSARALMPYMAPEQLMENAELGLVIAQRNARLHPEDPRALETLGVHQALAGLSPAADKCAAGRSAALSIDAALKRAPTFPTAAWRSKGVSLMEEANGCSRGG